MRNIDALKLVVRTDNNTGIPIGGFRDGVEWIVRIPRQFSGWQGIRYKGKLYQLWGGIRTSYWIRLNHEERIEATT